MQKYTLLQCCWEQQYNFGLCLHQPYSIASHRYWFLFGISSNGVWGVCSLYDTYVLPVNALEIMNVELDTVKNVLCHCYCSEQYRFQLRAALHYGFSEQLKCSIAEQIEKSKSMQASWFWNNVNTLIMNEQNLKTLAVNAFGV